MIAIKILFFFCKNEIYLPKDGTSVLFGKFFSIFLYIIIYFEFQTIDGGFYAEIDGQCSTLFFLRKLYLMWYKILATIVLTCCSLSPVLVFIFLYFSLSFASMIIELNFFFQTRVIPNHSVWFKCLTCQHTHMHGIWIGSRHCLFWNYLKINIALWPVHTNYTVIIS